MAGRYWITKDGETIGEHFETARAAKTAKRLLERETSEEYDVSPTP